MSWHILLRGLVAVVIGFFTATAFMFLTSVIYDQWFYQYQFNRWTPQRLLPFVIDAVQVVTSTVVGGFAASLVAAKLRVLSATLVGGIYVILWVMGARSFENYWGTPFPRWVFLIAVASIPLSAMLGGYLAMLVSKRPTRTGIAD